MSRLRARPFISRGDMLCGKGAASPLRIDEPMGLAPQRALPPAEGTRPLVSHVQGSIATLAIGALGVVYGDIGTSPLYALRECFAGDRALPITSANVLGILCL